MKKYFVEWLPTIDTIKVGDRVIHPSYNDGNPIKVTTDTEADVLSDGGQNTKLFLCSKDINVGDKVIEPCTYDGTMREYTVVKTPEKFRRDVPAGINPEVNSGNPISLNQFTFKLIGQISPNATWVKAGDEFEKSEVQYNIRKELNNFESGMDWTHCEYDVIIFFKIKGPCGHFH